VLDLNEWRRRSALVDWLVAGGVIVLDGVVIALWAYLLWFCIMAMRSQ